MTRRADITALRALPGFAGFFRPVAPRGGWWELVHAKQLWVLVGALFLVNVLVAFPGTMTNDSLNQYAEATSGRFTDWHPPVMAWVWGELRRHVAEGPAPMFLLHMLAWWGGIGLVAHGALHLGHRRSALLVALAGAVPTFLFLNAQVIKDVGMSAALLAGFGLVFWHRAHARRMGVAAIAGAALLLAYGTLVRTNAVFAIGPLVLYALAPVRWLRTVRLVVASAIIAVLAIPLSQQVNQALFHPVKRDAVNQLFVYDLIGIARHTGDPSILEPYATLTMQDIRRCYTPFWWDSFSAWGPCGKSVHRPDPDHATYGDGLPQHWLRMIAAHPVAWLAHKLKHFNSELYFLVPLKHLRLAPEYRADDPSIKPYEVFSPASVKLDLLRKNPTVWPVTWVVWGIALLAFLAHRSATTPVLAARALVVSALGYSCAYLMIGVATDARYHHWSMLACLLATLLVLPHIARGVRHRSPVLFAGFAAVAFVVVAGLATRLLDFQAWVF